MKYDKKIHCLPTNEIPGIVAGNADPTEVHDHPKALCGAPLETFQVDVDTLTYWLAMPPVVFARQKGMRMTFRATQFEIIEFDACEDCMNHPDLELLLLAYIGESPTQGNTILTLKKTLEVKEAITTFLDDLEKAIFK